MGGRSSRIGRQEFEQYKRDQARARREPSAQAQELQRELEALRVINQQLEARLAKQDLPELEGSALAASVSRKRIEELVEQMLANPDINIRYLPDAVERQLYRNVFGLLVNVLAELLKTSSVELMGHRIQLNLVAAED